MSDQYISSIGLVQTQWGLYLSWSWAIHWKYIEILHTWHWIWSTIKSQAETHSYLENDLWSFLNWDLLQNNKCFYSVLFRGIVCCFRTSCEYGWLRRPIYSPFGYRRVQELFRMKNIWNDNNMEGMTVIWKEWH